HIALSSDRKHITNTKVTVASILCHHRKNIVFYLLHGGLQERDCRPLAEVVATLGINCRFIPLQLKGNAWQGVPTSKSVPEATCCRLSLPSLLPNLDRVIYVDSNVVVYDDIQELWDLDIGQYSCAAMKIHDYAGHLEPLRGYDGFNAGVMCFNLAMMRKNHAEKRFQEAGEKFKDKLLFCCEDILNLVFRDECLALPRRWNVTSGIYQRTGSYASIPEEEALEILRAPSAVHFTTERKPWHLGEKTVDHPHSFLYSSYAALADCPLWFRFKMFLKYPWHGKLEASEWARKYGDSLLVPPARPLTPEELRQAQLLELKILHEIQRVCRKNDIQFFLIGGTLLGAFRHNGFIPWDDDLDVAMLREDYDRFLEIAPNELGEEFWINHLEKDLTYGHLFAKVMLKNTKWSSGGVQNIMARQGIYVDIFPFDRIASQPKDQKKHYRQAKKYRRLLRLKTKYPVKRKSLFPAIRQYFTWVYASLLKLPEIHRRVHRLFDDGHRQADANNPICTAVGANYCGSARPEEWFRDLVPHRFEDGEFPVPRSSEDILKYQYGDYMKLPPEDKRRAHGINDFCFGPYGDSPHA
ncbi:MAG: LicD family protein, partial [Desulforhabdus sp.]|nr:LicD family protein [Desulforhabdus sp.]